MTGGLGAIYDGEIDVIHAREALILDTGVSLFEWEALGSFMVKAGRTRKFAKTGDWLDMLMDME